MLSLLAIQLPAKLGQAVCARGSSCMYVGGISGPKSNDPVPAVYISGVVPRGVPLNTYIMARTQRKAASDPPPTISSNQRL